MPGTTPVYGIPYQSLSDPPNGPDLGQDLAGTVETELTRMDTVPKVTTFTSSGTWTKNVSPAPRWVEVEVWGGGGGGGAAGGAGSGSSNGGGGGGGGYTRKIYAASALSATQAVTVGAGGTGNPTNGGTGGTSSFSGLSATGGTGGESMNATTGNSFVHCGDGGVGSGGDENRVGSDGGKGIVIGGQPTFANFGGAAGGGGGTLVQFFQFGAAVGTAGKSPGGGASGSYATATGKNGTAGAAGRVRVVEHF